MTRKRKSNLSRKSKTSRRIDNSVNQLTAEEKEIRREQQRIRIAEYRASLTPEQREEQRAIARSYKRKKLNPAELALKRERGRLWNAQYRASLTDEQRDEHRMKQRLYNKTHRARQKALQLAAIQRELSMQSKVMKQEETVVSKPISQIANGNNTNNLLIIPFISTQDPDEPINNSQMHMEQKRAELQQQLQSIKTEITALEKSFEAEIATFQIKMSMIKYTYTSVELALINMDVKVCGDDHS